MKKFTKLAMSAAILTTFSSASMAMSVGGWKLFPGVQDDFIFDPTLSVMAGQMIVSESVGKAALGAGLELSINCPMIQPPTNRVRQQISFFNYSSGTSTVNTVELNPHYVVEVMPKLEIGGGPGVGFVNADVDGKTANMAAVQLGGSIHYRMSRFFIGAEGRYQWTTDGEDNTASDNGVKNARALVKIGFDF